MGTNLGSHHGSSSHRPSFHPSFSLGLSIIEALKLTKFRGRSKSNITTIDFDNTNVHNVKHFLPSFDGKGLFVLLLMLSMGVPSAYGCSMDVIDKICDDHPLLHNKNNKYLK